MYTLLSVLIAGSGAFVGGSIRYLATIITNKFVYSYSNNPQNILPFALIVTTALINIFGSFLITLLIGVLQNAFNYNPLLKIFLITGILGGFTTFSTFSFDFIYLIQNKFTYIAILYAITSVIFALLGATIGLKLATFLK